MRWATQKTLLSILAFLLLSVPSFSEAADSQTDTFTGKVVGISDGNTISVRTRKKGSRDMKPSQAGDFRKT
jgi:endonuclease YncB( thermonuclease family)